jgi:iron-sulfur cluster assembly protein
MLDKAKTPTETDGIRLTPAAATKLKNIIKDNQAPESMYLYVGVKGGGCAGLQYLMDLRDATTAPPDENDEMYASEGIVVVADLKSYIVGNLTGTEIDYEESLMGSGFRFNNPNSKRSCSCGQSYSA